MWEWEIFTIRFFFFFKLLWWLSGKYKICRLDWLVEKSRRDAMSHVTSSNFITNQDNTSCWVSVNTISCIYIIHYTYLHIHYTPFLWHTNVEQNSNISGLTFFCDKVSTIAHLDITLRAIWKFLQNHNCSIAVETVWPK